MDYFDIMKCTHPLYAIDFGLSQETGKHIIKIAPKRADRSSFQDLEFYYGKGNIVSLPCGQCAACRVNYVRSWSVRCLLEASLYQHNYFVTLTFDEKHYENKLSKKHISDFMKRLRNYVPGVRFFCSGERGDHTNRCHYHIILFNCPLPDLRFVYKNKGNFYYDSDLLKKCWQKGFITISDVNLTTCDYVTNYVVKKFKTDNDDEFVHMSNRPGIGAGYFEKHFKDIYKSDGVYIKGQKYKVPRYFDKLLERTMPIFYSHLKKDRISDIDFSRVDDLIRHGFIYDEEVYQYNADANYSRIRVNLEKGVF